MKDYQDRIKEDIQDYRDKIQDMKQDIKTHIDHKNHL